MIQLVREQNYLESLKNLKDLQELGTHEAHSAAWSIATGLVLYHRGQMLKFERQEQEKQWDRESGCSVVTVVLVCAALSATVTGAAISAAVGWHWIACWLGIAAAGIAYLAFTTEDTCPK